MFHFFGFLLAVGILRSAFWILGMESRFYYDDVALIIVLGGTITAGIITFPVKDLTQLLKAFFKVVKRTPESKALAVKKIVFLSIESQKSSAALVKALDEKKLSPFLKDGLELMSSGFSREEVEEIMTERIYRDRERDQNYGMLIRTLAKYPPAFGLVGTVLGLVALMRAVSMGADSNEVGMRMALALVATLYGLLFANFVLVPLSENLMNKSNQYTSYKELILEGILLLYDKKSPLVVQEVLNSYLPPLSRDDYLGVKDERAA